MEEKTRVLFSKEATVEDVWAFCEEGQSIPEVRNGTTRAWPHTCFVPGSILQRNELQSGNVHGTRHYNYCRRDITSQLCNHLTVVNKAVQFDRHNCSKKYVPGIETVLRFPNGRFFVLTKTVESFERPSPP